MVIENRNTNILVAISALFGAACLVTALSGIIANIFFASTIDSNVLWLLAGCFLCACIGFGAVGNLIIYAIK